MTKGIVKYYIHSKGFGFIRTERGDIFVHKNSLSEPIRNGDEVVFNVRTFSKKPMAVNVKLFREASETL